MNNGVYVTDTVLSINPPDPKSTGFLHAHPARPPCVPVRGSEGDREGFVRAGGQGLRPQGAPPRRSQNL